MLPGNTQALSQDWLLMGGVLLLALFMAWRGWRLGVMRLLLGLIGLVAGYWFGSSAGSLLGGIIPLLPDSLLSIGSGIMLALIAYLLARALGAMLFKRTAQQEAKLLRWAYGSLGALLGLAEAAALIWMVSAGLRLSDTMAEGSALKGKLSTWVALTKGLQEGSLGALLQAVDPVPSHYYKLVVNGFKAINNPRLLGDFLSSKEAQQLAKHPKVVALRNDPAFERQIRTGNIIELLANPLFIAVLTDSQVRQLLLQPEMAKALEKSAQQRSDSHR